MDEFPVRTLACARDFFETGVVESFQEVTDLLGHRLTFSHYLPNMLVDRICPK